MEFPTETTTNETDTVEIGHFTHVTAKTVVSFYALYYKALTNNTTIPIFMIFFTNSKVLFRIVHIPYRSVIRIAQRYRLQLGLWVRKLPEISCGIFPEISGKITVLFRNNSAKKFSGSLW